MSNSAMIPSLLFFTLIAVLVVIAVGYLLFIRKRGNRHPVEHPRHAAHSMAPKESDRSR